MSRHKIDREALRLIENIEKSLQEYHGLRLLWANQVANGRPMIGGTKTVVDADELEQEQFNRLWGAIGQALSLHSHLWPGQNTPHTLYHRVGAEKRDLALLVDNADAAFDVCQQLVDYQASFAEASQQDGRMPGNDQWSDRAMEIVAAARKVLEAEEERENN